MGGPGNCTVTIKYFGTVSKWTGISEEKLETAADFTSSVEKLRKRIEQLTEGKVLYSILHNGKAINTINQETARISEGDIFNVVPVILGG